MGDSLEPLIQETDRKIQAAKGPATMAEAQDGYELVAWLWALPDDISLMHGDANAHRRGTA